MTTDNFTHLHTHSHYSLLDGAGTPQQYAARAAELGQPALALTDHGSLSGIFAHYKACKEAGIKPIIGCEFYVSPNARTSKEASFWGTPEQRREDISGAGKYTHLTVLARSSRGLRNLYRLQRQSYDDGFYGKPRIDKEALSRWADDLIVLSGCAGSELATRLRLGQLDEARQVVQWYKSIFGDRYFIEVMDHGMEWEVGLNEQLLRLAEDLRVPVVATGDAHYCTDEDTRIHDAYLCLQTRAKLSDEKRFRFDGTGYYLQSRREMDLSAAKSVGRLALDNTLVVADMVGDYDEMFVKKIRMPKPFEAKDSGQVLWTQLTYKNPLGLDLSEKTDYSDRLQTEFRVINKLGFSEYFLTLKECIDLGREKGIVFGPARGSAGGSLVAYALGITDLDPLAHGLLFERFLNEARVSLPDIDIDIDDRRRQEFIDLVVDRFGEDYVAVIGTFGTIGAKAALHDAARVLSYPRKVSNDLVSCLPPPIYGRQPDLADGVFPPELYPDVRNLAIGLEGLIRTQSQHAAGVIISPVPVVDVVPVWKQKLRAEEAKAAGREFSHWITSFDMHEVEEVGLVKMDFLGLRTLGVIDETLSML